MILFTLSLLLIRIQFSWGVPTNSEHFISSFRSDYHYVAETETYYKEHTTPKTWCEAVATCSAEGAELATPLTAVEALHLRSIKTKDSWLGLNDLLVEGKFRALNGTTISGDLYTNWDSGEPFDIIGNEDCVVMFDNAGIYNDIDCGNKYLFICSKRQSEDAVCETNDKAPGSNTKYIRPHFRNDYDYIAEINTHYRWHRTPKTWCEAMVACKAEGAELATPLTASEARVLRSLSSADTWLGFNDMLVEGTFKTLNGTPISGEIYTNWNSGDPNNGGSNEDCVVMLSKTGLYNDINCHNKFQFICTKHNSEIKPTQIVCETGDTRKEIKRVKNPLRECPPSEEPAPFFRKDYNYDCGSRAFYKEHESKKKWRDAVTSCAAEGAWLATPLTEGDARALLDRMEDDSVFLGIHNMFSEGNFVTLNGTLVLNIFTNWRYRKPNSASGTEDCVELSSDGFYDVVKCDVARKFICKKDLSTLTHNPNCETYDTEYFNTEQDDRCYKFHKTARSWTDAYKTCLAEESFLGIINSATEATVYVNTLKRFPQETSIGNVHSGLIHVGFNDLITPGDYQTIDGKPLSEAGYGNWTNDQPANASEARCGAMLRNGKLNAIGCHVKAMFICEKTLGETPKLDIDIRFNANED